MEQFYIEKLFKLKTAINELEIKADCPIKRIEALIGLIVDFLSKYVLKRGFKDINEEIRFSYNENLSSFLNSSITMLFT